MPPWSRNDADTFTFTLTALCLALFGAVGCDEADSSCAVADAGPPGTGGGRRDGGAASATPCGLAADHELVFALTDARWAQVSQASGGRTLWRATAPLSAGRIPSPPASRSRAPPPSTRR